MRLTLRTLLAYVDNILDPQDRDLLEKKVQESEFAQNLIRRSRDAVNDQELSASEPIGHGLRQDPNLVAEYLDNTMAREQIEEFERQCLDMSSDADTRLAEITACHHILTMVLGEPLQFSASSREKMYRVGEDGTAPANQNREQGDWSTKNIDPTSGQDERFSEEQSQSQDPIATASETAFGAEDLAYRSKIVSTKSNGTTLTTAESGTIILQSTDGAELTLPPTAAGLRYTFIWVGTAGQEFDISPNASDKIL